MEVADALEHRPEVGEIGAREAIAGIRGGEALQHPVIQVERDVQVALALHDDQLLVGGAARRLPAVSARAGPGP